MSKSLVTTNGVSFIVSDEDYDDVRQHRWNARPKGYIVRTDRSRAKYTVHLHREIMRDADGLLVDHINGDPTDNRRENLRVVTNQQNQFNAKVRRDNKSGYKGVSWYPKYNKWVAAIRINKRRKSLGYFEDKEDAAKAYNIAAETHFGEYAKLNNIKGAN